jgi:hypothetical protein
MLEPTNEATVCLVAILKDETPFLAEWIAYHRLVGVQHFFIYDNDPDLPLRRHLEAQSQWVTVVDWPGAQNDKPGNACQTAAYLDSLDRIRSRFRWVAFLDGDEFIVLRRHGDLARFLPRDPSVGAVQLQWHLFGHNGHLEDPPGLVTSALIRRCADPNPKCKSISRIDAIRDIWTPHFCELQEGFRRIDANGKAYSDQIYPGMTEVAHINHYRCRSFRRWMSRARRGDAMGARHLDEVDSWRLEEPTLLRHFVEVVATYYNEVVDEHLVAFAPSILATMGEMGFAEPEPAAADHSRRTDLRSAWPSASSAALQPKDECAE